jgi:signal transduction histidine kinase
VNLKTTLLQRLAAVAAVFNVGGLGFAIAVSEPTHAVVHGVLALGFGYWAQRLRSTPASDVAEMRQQLEDQAAALEDTQNTLASHANQLLELQERLDFAERVLTQIRDRQALEK